MRSKALFCLGVAHYVEVPMTEILNLRADEIPPRSYITKPAGEDEWRVILKNTELERRFTEKSHAWEYLTNLLAGRIDP